MNKIKFKISAIFTATIIVLSALIAFVPICFADAPAGSQTYTYSQLTFTLDVAVDTYYIHTFEIPAAGVSENYTLISFSASFYYYYNSTWYSTGALTTLYDPSVSSNAGIVSIVFSTDKILISVSRGIDNNGSVKNFSASITVMKNPTLTIDANGGTVASGETTLTLDTYSGTIETPPCEITPPAGYYLSGWNSAQDGSGTDFIFGTTVLSTDLTIYAQFAKPVITYELNGGSVVSGTSTVAVDYLSTFGELTLPSISRSGYRFLAWYLDSSFNLPLVDALQTEIDTDTTIFAEWIQTFTVRFDAAGGNISSGSAVQTVDIHGNAIPPTVSRDGYVLSKWNGAYTDVDSSRTITAVWLKLSDESRIVNVSYDISDGISAGDTNERIYVGTTFGELHFPIVSREGYNFAGWYFGSEKIDNIQNVEITGDVTITARFEQIAQPRLNIFQLIWRWFLSLFGF